MTLTGEGIQRAQLPQGELRYYRRGSGQPVVLMHTLRTQLEYFEPLIDTLDLTRFEVIAVDLPGHGESSAEPVEHTANFFADQIEQFLDALDLQGVILAGDSIGATIALIVAARHNPRVRSVVAVNTYDYGTRGGVRRNSLLANVLFSTLILPGIGAAAVHTEMEWQIRRVVRSGLHDPSKLPPELPTQMARAGKRPGHARAFRSLMVGWRTWLAARSEYGKIEVPVILAYGDEDWANPGEREANAKAIPAAQFLTIENAGHFASIDRPDEIARLIEDAARAPAA